MGRRIALLLLLGALLQGCLAISHLSDELLWTKSEWGDYTIDFPWSDRYQKRDDVTAAVQGGMGAEWETSSLDGPFGDLPARVAEHLKRPKSKSHSFDVSLLDGDAQLKVAAATASCKVCLSLARALLQGLYAWVDRTLAMPSAGQVSAYADQLCMVEVPVSVLKEWVLLRARVSTGGRDANGMNEFYMINQRSGQIATRAELLAVRWSCRDLLTADNHDIVEEALKSLTQYHQTLLAIVQASGAKAVAVATEVTDELLAEQCVDKHPSCEFWASKGECTSNPVYMVGDDDARSGWCRRSCKECTPAVVPSPLSSEDEVALAGPAKSLLTRFLKRACTDAPPCTAPGGSGLAKADKLGGDLLVSGPVVAAAPRAEAADPELLQSSIVSVTRPLAEAAVPASKLEVSQEGATPETPSTGAGAALHDALQGKCHYLTVGWWSYQLCYQRHLTQFHADHNAQVDWAISMGAYASSQWAHPGSKVGAALFPGRTVRYIPQVYDRGNVCKADDDEEEEEGDEYADGLDEAPPPPRARQTEVQLMCSPNAASHVVVLEPSPCRYVVEWYVPELCGVAGFGVAGVAAPGGGGGAAAAAGGEGEEYEDLPDTPQPPA